MDIVVKAVEAMNYAGGDTKTHIDMRIIDSHGARAHPADDDVA